MNKIYFDNAATTALRPEVIEAIVESLRSDFGNPSSTHAYGRAAKSSIELARKSIAQLLGCSANEIIFTSGATEANNWIIRSAVRDLKLKRIISSKMEHHAVLYSVKEIAAEYGIDLVFVENDKSGHINLDQLADLLKDKTPTLVSLMHINNETGCILPIDEVAKLVKENGAYFHSDTVQSVGKLKIDLQQTAVDFITASAHKFHGPKGIGFAFFRKGLLTNPIFFGGEQEKGLRAGTESVHNIVGMQKALELAYERHDEEFAHISELKSYFISKLRDVYGDQARIHGHENTLYNLVNVGLPISQEKASMLLFMLDMKGFAISRGSACQSGSPKPSHVLAEMLDEETIKFPNLRVSFSHDNTKAEIDLLISELQKL